MGDKMNKRYMSEFIEQEGKNKLAIAAYGTLTGLSLGWTTLGGINVLDALTKNRTMEDYNLAFFMGGVIGAIFSAYKLVNNLVRKESEQRQNRLEKIVE